jgi:hypothetical protein
MSQENHCPACKGTGKMKVKVTSITSEGNTSEDVVMGCFRCDSGNKPMTAKQAASFTKAAEREKKKWCSCANSKGSHYVPDRASRVCSKHHWVCDDCGKITQVG